MRKNVLEMNKEEMLELEPENYYHYFLSPSEIVHIAEVLGAFWKFDYKEAELGRQKYHAKLKSGKHSDGFFVSKIMLQYENVRKIIADQMASGIHHLITNFSCDWVCGIPDGATKLGEDLAESLNTKKAKMAKDDGKIKIITPIPPGDSLLLCEDFCTAGTGFKEAVNNIVSQNPGVNIIPIEPVIINRGGLTSIDVEGVDSFKILALANYRIKDWEPDECKLCHDYGSEAIKPKATDENWEKITQQQH